MVVEPYILYFFSHRPPNNDATRMGARVDGAVYQEDVDAVRKRRYTHDEYKEVELVDYVRSRVRRYLFALRSSK